MPIPWDGSLAVGDPHIDADHERLISIYNRLSSAVECGEGCQIIDQIFIELAEYAMSHFEREERVMLRYHFHGYEAHKAAHDELLQRLSAVIDRSSSDRDRAVKETVDFLHEWVVDHIMSCDQELASFLVKVEAKA